MKNATAGTLLVGTALFGVGCVQTGEAPSSDADALETMQQITVWIDNNGFWTADALSPVAGAHGKVSARATFTGSGTTKAGVCLLQKYVDTANVSTPCTTVDDCAFAPYDLPTGGARYCTAPNGTGQKYCFFRPGSQTSFCAGSPAQGGAAIAADTLYTPLRALSQSGVEVLSYACFGGCSVYDPSSSGSVAVYQQD